MTINAKDNGCQGPQGDLALHPHTKSYEVETLSIGKELHVGYYKSNQNTQSSNFLSIVLEDLLEKDYNMLGVLDSTREPRRLDLLLK